MTFKEIKPGKPGRKKKEKWRPLTKKELKAYRDKVHQANGGFFPELLSPEWHKEHEEWKKKHKPQMKTKKPSNR